MIEIKPEMLIISERFVLYVRVYVCVLISVTQIINPVARTDM